MISVIKYEGRVIVVIMCMCVCTQRLQYFTIHSDKSYTDWHEGHYEQENHHPGETDQRERRLE